MSTLAPTPARPAALDCIPFFIVGSSRSGTTLLRLMLDSHPGLAVPDESHFIVHLHGRLLARRRPPAETLERVLRHPRFVRWGLDPDRVRELAARVPPRSYAEAIRVVFAAFAESEGKPRWGDKTPPYAAHMPLLSQLFPGAQFIHLIRDGREVASSLASHRWAPRSPIAAASLWRSRVNAARSAGAALGSGTYLELRLERLLADPEATLREVCDFLGEPYAPEMLDYHRTAAERVWSGDPADHWFVDHRHLSSAPTVGLRDWRTGLSARQQAALEAACQPLLAELGYSAGRPSVVAKLTALGHRLSMVAWQTWRTWRNRTLGSLVELGYWRRRIWSEK